MLRIYVAQQCFGFYDEGIENAIYDSQAISAFIRIDIGRESAPDATTLFKFCHRLEGRPDALDRRSDQSTPRQQGLDDARGTIVDARLIAAPPSPKNEDGKRGPEIHQSKKGYDWHFGMKAHIGVDPASGLVHTVVSTASNASDVTQTHAFFHGDEIATLVDAAAKAWKCVPKMLAKR